MKIIAEPKRNLLKDTGLVLRLNIPCEIKTPGVGDTLTAASCRCLTESPKPSQSSLNGAICLQKLRLSKV